MPTAQDDYLTYHGAYALCRQIITYWKDRGYPAIDAAPYEIGEAFGMTYGIASNMRNGYPPREAPKC